MLYKSVLEARNLYTLLFKDYLDMKFNPNSSHTSKREGKRKAAVELTAKIKTYLMAC